MTTALLLLCALLTAVCLWLWRRAKPAAPGSGLSTQQRELERRNAADEERHRIMNDLHDDIGAKLLTLVHTLKEPEQADLARAVLQDLRDVVSRSHSNAGTLLEVLAQIRDETENRLDLLHAALLWEQDPNIPDPPLDEPQSLNLFRIAREAVTNAIRHGHAHRVRVRVKKIAHDLVFDVTDDGAGFDAERIGAGRGTHSMQERAAELHGEIAWNPGTQGGTKVVLRFPLPRMGDGAGDAQSRQ